MIFYDFEVTEYDWIVVSIDMYVQEETVIVNDKEKLENYYSKNKNKIWAGYNSRHYDQYILKGILANFNPKKVNDWIIVKDLPGWAFSDLLKKFPLINYDVMLGNDRGLKVLEGFLGNSIKETSVPFDIDRKLTEREIQEMILYCRHDVEQTIEIFLERKNEFEAQLELLKMFNLPITYISKTKVQLAAEILQASKKTYNDEFDISLPETARIKKYKEVLRWYQTKENMAYTYETEKGTKRKKQLKTKVAGVPHVFGWGGVHGARKAYAKQGYFLNMDVASLYPSLMINYNLHSRSCNPQRFNNMVETRLKYKAEKNQKQAPLKIVINGTYGAMKDKNNKLYDPRQANNVCVYGQILLLDLLERLETVGEIVQSNTDGILLKMPEGENIDDWYDRVDDIAAEWEKRTGLRLEFEEYVKIYQKDVNNYIMIDAEGKTKKKGAYVKKLDKLDYDLAIVNKAMNDYILKNISLEETIYNCDDLKDFQQVKKISKKYLCLYHGNKRLNEKCARVFASKDLGDPGLMKLHATTKKLAKVENTPEHLFIFNGDVNGMRCPDKLDKKWYLLTAKKRLEGFGL